MSPLAKRGRPPPPHMEYVSCGTLRNLVSYTCAPFGTELTQDFTLQCLKGVLWGV